VAIVWELRGKDLSHESTINFDPLLIVRGPILKKNRKGKTTLSRSSELNFDFIFRSLPNFVFEFPRRALPLPFHDVTLHHKRARELKRIPLDLDENAHVSFKLEHIN
jgi:hypothetical protein